MEWLQRGGLMPTGDEVKSRKVDLVQVADELAEGALAGEVIRVAMVMMNPEGGLTLRVAGCRPSDGLSMLHLGGMILARGLLGH